MVQKKKGDEDEELSAQPSEDIDEEMLIDIKDPKQVEAQKSSKPKKPQS